MWHYKRSKITRLNQPTGDASEACWSVSLSSGSARRTAKISLTLPPLAWLSDSTLAKPSKWRAVATTPSDNSLLKVTSTSSGHSAGKDSWPANRGKMWKQERAVNLKNVYVWQEMIHNIYYPPLPSPTRAQRMIWKGSSSRFLGMGAIWENGNFSVFP